MPTNQPTHIRDVLPAVAEALKQPKNPFEATRPGLLSEILERIDEEVVYSKRRETPRKEKHFARGRAHGIIDAMRIVGLLNEQQTIDWIGYLEGCVPRESLIVDREAEETQEINDWLARHKIADDTDESEPTNQPPCCGEDEIPF